MKLYNEHKLKYQLETVIREKGYFFYDVRGL